MSKSKSKNNKNNNDSTTKKNESNAKKAQNDILKQYGLQEEYVPLENDEVEEVETIKADKKVKGHVPSNADNIGWNKPLVLLKNGLYGIFMGLSDGVPGYSGGTTLNFIGFYKDLISNIKSIFRPDVKKYFWKYLIWVLPFILTWIGTLIGFMFVVKAAGESNNGVVLVFLFGFFALFAIPIFYISNKDKIPNYKDIIFKKERNRLSYVYIAIFIIAFLVMISCGIVARFVSSTSINVNGVIETIKGVTFNKDDNFDVNIISDDTVSNVIPLLIYSFIAGFVILIPGLSGSLVLFMSNWYTKISTIISDLFSGKHEALQGLPYLVVVALGIILGIVVSSMFIHWAMNKFEKQFYAASLGFVCAGFIAIFIALSDYDYKFLSSNTTTLALSISMIPIAFIINGSIFIFLNQTNRIEYPRLRMFKKQEKVVN